LLKVDISKPGKARGAREDLIIILIKGEVANQTDIFIGRALIVCPVSLRNPLSLFITLADRTK
jgi:hypothetical protein